MGKPFIGANNGGSSATFLIELARVLARTKHYLTYQVVLFDGEEAVAHWSATDGLYGSRYLQNDSSRTVLSVKLKPRL